MGDMNAPSVLRRVLELDEADAQMFRRAVMETGTFQDLFIVVKHADEATRREFFEAQPEGQQERIRELVEETETAEPDRLAEAEKTIAGLLDGPAIRLALARARYDQGRYDEAGREFEAVFESGGGDRDAYYSAACCWALAGDLNAAFRNLDRAVEAGWRDVSQLESDIDLKVLHEDPRWDKLVARVESARDGYLAGLPASHEPRAFIELPPPRLDGACSVEKAMYERRSVRRYADGPLSLDEVSQLLWSAYGVTKPMPNGPDFLRGGLKTAPSAGALYPLDVYLVAGDVTGLEPGIYLYYPDGHRLGRLTEHDVRRALCDAALGQAWIRQAPASLVYSAVYERNTGKYGQRGRERYVCMDLGHSAENVYLQCGALGLGTCAIGAFLDVEVKKVVGMTTEEEPLYIMPVGRLTE